MKKGLLLSAVVLSLMMSISSCSKDEDLIEEDPFGINDLSGSSIVATGSAIESEIDQRAQIVNGQCLSRYTFQGSVDLNAIADKSFTLGFLYGTNEDLTIQTAGMKVSIKDLVDYSDNTFAIPVGHLSIATKYYYRAFLTIDGRNYYGKIKQINTYVPEVDKYVDDWSISGVSYYLNYNENTTVRDARNSKVNSSIKITKKGNNKLSVEIPIFRPGSSNDFTSFDTKTFTASIDPERQIVINDGDTEISIELFHSFTPNEEYSGYGKTIIVRQITKNENESYFCSFSASGNIQKNQ